MASRFHKEVMVASYTKDKFLAQIVVKLKDAVGALSDVATIIAEAGADIRHSASYSDPSGEFAVLNAFIVPGSPKKLAELLDKIRASPSVLEAETKEGQDNSVIDMMTFPVRFADQRVVLLGSNALVHMFGAIESVFGSGGSVIIYQQGKNYGRALAESLSKTLTRRYMVKNHLYGLGLVAAMGWGMPSVLNSNEALTSLTVRMDECTLCRDPAKGPSAGFFVAGSLAGIYSFLSGKELQGKETKCIASGDHHCEFDIA